MRHSLLLALLCHFVLAGGYWAVTPALEAPREEEVLERASLCALRVGMPGRPRDAYSLLLGNSLQALGHPDLIACARPTDGPGALRLEHGLDEWLGSGAQSTLAALRLLSVLLGAVSIVCVHKIARLVFPRTGVAAVAAWALAGMPQWACSHAVLWHGVLLTAAAHLTLLLLVTGVVRGRFAASHGALAGAVTALAVCTAPAGWYVALVGVLAHALTLRSAPRVKSTWCALGTFALCAGGAWFVADKAPPLPSMSVPERGILALLHSFVGEFGRSALPLPWPLAIVTLLLIGVAAFGCVRGARQLASSPAALTLLTASCSLGTVAGVQAALRDGMHGRHLLIAAGPMLLMTGAGLVAAWRRLAPRAWQATLHHPAAVLVPSLPSLLVLLLQVAPNARLPQCDDVHFATLHSGLRSTTDQMAIAPFEPMTSNATPAPLVSKTAPQLARNRFVVGHDRHAYSLLGWRSNYQLLFATYERDGQVLTEPTWQVPDALFSQLDFDEHIAWRVRTLPNLRRRETSVQSTVQVFVRVP